VVVVMRTMIISCEYFDVCFNLSLTPRCRAGTQSSLDQWELWALQLLRYDAALMDATV
jgi:hypothetical protein